MKLNSSGTFGILSINTNRETYNQSQSNYFILDCICMKKEPSACDETQKEPESQNLQAWT